MLIHTSEQKEMQRLLAQRTGSFWGPWFAGVLVGIIGMHVFVSRPLMTQVGQLDRNLAKVNLELQPLVGTRSHVAQTNTLLGQLTSQQAQLDNARRSVETLRQLRTEVEAESRSTAQAIAAVTQFADLQYRLIEQGKLHPQSDMTLQAMSEIHKGLDEFLARVETRLTDIPAAEAGIHQLAELKDLLVRNSSGLEQARVELKGLIEIQDELAKQTGETVLAQQAAEELIELKNQIYAGTEHVEEAQSRAEAVIALKNQLSSQSTDQIQQAQKNLDSFVALGTTLSQQAKLITSAIETAELLQDFQTEFASQMEQLAAMRRSLVDLVMLESTVSRAVKTLQPLVQLGNLRRLGDEEIRTAARMILDRRSVASESTTSVAESTDASKPTISRPVPEPKTEAAAETNQPR